jgi:hypothetical protein
MSPTHPTPAKRSWTRFPILLILLTALTVTWWTANGCGTNVNTQSVRLDAAFDRSGILRSDATYNSITLYNTVFLGDDANNLPSRAFVSVVLAPVPPGANVTKVLLHLEGHILFGNPFDDFGAISVDHVNVVAGIGAADFSGNVITASIATIPPLPTDPSMFMTVELDITAQVKADIAAGRPISSFRLQFNSAPSVDKEVDIAEFYASTTTPAQQFYATVTIQP